MPAERAEDAPVRLLVRAFAPAWRDMTGFALLLLAVWACELVLPLLLGRTVDAAVAKTGLPRLAEYGAVMLGVIVTLYWTHRLYLRREAELVAAATFRLRHILYARLIAQPLAFFQKAKGGEIGHRIMNDAEVLDKHAIYLIADVPFAAMTVLGVLAVMAVTHLWLAGTVLAVLLAATLSSQAIGRPLAGLEKTANAAHARLGGRLQQLLGGMRTVKAFGREQREIAGLDAAARDLQQAEIEAGRIGARLEPALEIIHLLGLVIVVWLGAYLVSRDELTPGQLVAFVAYMELLSEPFALAGRYYRQFQQCRGTMRRISDLLATLPPLAPRRGGARDGPLSVELSNVSFSYPGAGRPALRDVSIEARPGEVVALVGPNGAGKSTLLDLLAGFAAPEAGTILAGDLPLGAWDEAALRGAVSVMSQDVFLFHASLAENIRYGAPEAGEAEIAAAAAQAGLDPLLARLPEGLAAIVGDRGAKLSGGERQRVALARLLLAPGRIVLLDEPTSAVDGAALDDVNRAIAELGPSRTIVVVAHRAETVALADRVVILGEGAVIASGPRAELVAHPLFRRLFETERAARKGPARRAGTGTEGE
ncbi:ABC transporter ATP-binding protein [Aureimonas endophytica]|uniref:ABC transporter ATP-binding protein n=2 Tax=Aureimonas endophytica TaxID=2027858 RepID=A0A917A0G5_9HYPH|nr:ABC transporter ATP-binding protein [Aureimonas endophytica]